MTITRNFKLYLNAGTASAPYINVNQYDEGEQWVFDLYTEGGQKFTPSTGAIIGIKSDGNAILNSGTVNASGQVVITETQQMTAAGGLAVFELLIEGETHGTANFIVNVERRPSDDAEFSDSDLSMLQEAINSAAEIEDLLGGQDVPTVITPIISDWLDENITNPSNPPIDTSLTVAGAAADAKIVGDKITPIENLSEINLLNNVSWEVGSINAITGNNVSDQRRIRTIGYIDLFGIFKFTLKVNSGYKFVVDWYNDNNQVVSINNHAAWQTGENTYFTWEGATKIRIVVATTSDETANVNFSEQLSVSADNTIVNTVNVINSVDVLNKNKYDFGFVLGTLNPNAGTEADSNTRIRSEYLKVSKGTKLFTAPNTLVVYEYDNSKKYISDSSWSSEYTVQNDGYVRILIRKGNANQSISSDEIDTLVETLKIYRSYSQEWIEKTAQLILNDEIPTYFETQFNTAIDSIKTNIFETGISGDSFAFITDLHWQSNAKHSPNLIKGIVKSTNIDKIICGGDLIGGGTKTAMVKLMDDCVNAFKGIAPFYSILGNHDLNTIGAPSASDNFTKSQAYALFQKQSDMLVKYGSLNYFYFDNPTTKTRYVCLDTGLEGTSLDSVQSTWLSSTLSSMPSGYHAIVFAHIIYQTTTTWHVGLTKSELAITSFMSAVCNILDTFNANNDDKKVEAIFGGHVHIDCDFVTTGGIPIVLTDCDARQTFTETSTGSGVANHAVNTINEQCFDVITVNYNTKTIKCVRIGRGSDRTISY